MRFQAINNNRRHPLFSLFVVIGVLALFLLANYAWNLTGYVIKDTILDREALERIANEHEGTNYVRITNTDCGAIAGQCGKVVKWLLSEEEPKYNNVWGWHAPGKNSRENTLNRPGMEEVDVGPNFDDYDVFIVDGSGDDTHQGVAINNPKGPTDVNDKVAEVGKFYHKISGSQGSIDVNTIYLDKETGELYVIYDSGNFRHAEKDDDGNLDHEESKKTYVDQIGSPIWINDPVVTDIRHVNEERGFISKPGDVRESKIKEINENSLVVEINGVETELNREGDWFVDEKREWYVLDPGKYIPPEERDPDAPEPISPIPIGSDEGK